MRIRTIRPEFYESETIGALSWDARLVFISLWSYAEDNGVNRDNARLIRGTCFAYDADVSVARIEAALDELESAGCIRRYIQNGKRLLWIPNFHRYQKIDRPSLTHFTPPEDDSASTREYSRDTSEYSTPHHDTLPTHSGTVDSTDTREYSMDTHETPASTSKNGRNKPKTSDEKKDSTDTREYSRDTSDRSRSRSRSRSNKRNSPYRESKESAARFDAPPASTGVDDSENESVDAQSSRKHRAVKVSEQSDATTGETERIPTSSPNPSPAPAPDEIEVVQGELVPTDGVPAELTPTAGGDRRALLPGEKDLGPRPKNVDDWRPLERQVAKCSQLGKDPAVEAQKFRNYASYRAKPYKNFDRAFDNWLIRIEEEQARRSKSQMNQDLNMRMVMQAAQRDGNLPTANGFSEEDFR